MNFFNQYSVIARNVIEHGSQLQACIKLFREFFPESNNIENLSTITHKINRDHFGAIWMMPSFKISEEIKANKQSVLAHILGDAVDRIQKNRLQGAITSYPIIIQCPADLRVFDYHYRNESRNIASNYSDAFIINLYRFSCYLENVRLHSCICNKSMDRKFIQVTLTWNGPFENVETRHIPGYPNMFWITYNSNERQTLQLVNTLFLLFQAALTWGENRIVSVTASGNQLVAECIFVDVDKAASSMAGYWAYGRLSDETNSYFMQQHFEFFSRLVQDLQAAHKKLIEQLEISQFTSEIHDEIINKINQYVEILGQDWEEYMQLIQKI